MKSLANLLFVVSALLFVGAAILIFPAIIIVLLSFLNQYAPGIAAPLLERFLSFTLSLLNLPSEGFLLLLFGYPVWGFLLGVLGGGVLGFGYYLRKKIS